MTQYLGIKRACFLIALDNGGINRDRSEKAQARAFERWLALYQPQEILTAIDAWLLPLSDDELEIVCCGETSEMEAAMKNAPPFTSDLLNDYFDKVC